MSIKTEPEAGGLRGEHNQKEGHLMDTSSPIDRALRDATISRKKRREVEARLETPCDDLIEEARNAREKAEESTCIEHIKAK